MKSSKLAIVAVSLAAIVALTFAIHSPKTYVEYSLRFDRVEDGSDDEIVQLDLNGHPLVFQWRRAYDRKLNQLLTNSNEVQLRIVGPLEDSANVEILTNGQEVFDRTVLIQKQLSQSESLVQFAHQIQLPVKLEEITDDTSQQRENVKRELTKHLRDLFFQISERNGDDVANTLVNDGYRRWSKHAYRATDSNVVGVRNNVAKLVNDHGNRFREPDWDELNFEFGKSSVYVYARFSDAPAVLEPYLFEVDMPAEEGRPASVLHVWPLRYAKVDGRWVIWDFNRYG